VLLILGCIMGYRHSDAACPDAGKLMPANQASADEPGQTFIDLKARGDEIMWLHVGQPPADTPAFSSLMVSFQELQVGACLRRN
jgi:hypothetical protein